MRFGGSTLAANTSLKNNRVMLGKRKQNIELLKFLHGKKTNNVTEIENISYDYTAKRKVDAMLSKTKKEERKITVISLFILFLIISMTIYIGFY